MINLSAWISGLRSTRPPIPVLVEAVPEPQPVENGVHVDLRTSDFAGELARLHDLGARLLDRQPDPDLDVLADPDGTELGLVRP